MTSFLNCTPTQRRHHNHCRPPHIVTTNQASIFFSTLLSASHNTMSDYAFRKIDIDALDEDVLLPSDLYDPDPRGPDGVLEDAKRRSAEVRGLVSR